MREREGGRERDRVRREKERRRMERERLRGYTLGTRLPQCSRAVSLPGLPGVHDESPEEVSPGEVVEGVLFGGNGSRDYLSIEMVG